MDKFKAFLSDKKNTPIVGAVAGIVLVLVVLFYLKQFGIIGGGGGSQDVPAPDMSQATAPTDMSQQSAPTGGQPTDATQTSSGQAKSASAAVAVGKIPPMLAYRKDPFMGYSGPPKKNDALIAILPAVRHIRLAPARVESLPGLAQADEVLPPQPMRRVAGIMWGPTVKAILETGGKTILVKPGDVIPSERVRVESIEPSGLILTTLDTKRPMTIRVNLAGAPGAQGQGDPNYSNNNSTGETPPPRPNRSGQRGSGNSQIPNETPPPGF